MAFPKNWELILLAFILMLFVSSLRAIEIDSVIVGNINNPDDDTGRGGVSYTYKIGTYEVTNTQYTVFLNAVAKIDDPYGLYNSNMAGNYGGISRTGAGTSANPFVYISKGIDWDNRPIGWLSWYDAMRFCNWLHNDQPVGTPSDQTTENGAYNMDGDLTLGHAPAAKFWLPTEDEWYKAAYYDHRLNAGTGGYWDYATESNNIPIAEFPPGGINSANYLNTVGNATPIGSYFNSYSAYGTFDQMGNVWEMSESGIWSSGTFYYWQAGGGWGSNYSHLKAGAAGFYSIPYEDEMWRGFRVASVPEPASFCVLSLGIAIIAARRHKDG